MSSRTASCSCGQLRIQVEGEPRGVGICHCLACQQRTGSVFASLEQKKRYTAGHSAVDLMGFMRGILIAQRRVAMSDSSNVSLVRRLYQVSRRSIRSQIV